MIRDTSSQQQLTRREILERLGLNKSSAQQSVATVLDAAPSRRAQTRSSGSDDAAILDLAAKHVQDSIPSVGDLIKRYRGKKVQASNVTQASSASALFSDGGEIQGTWGEGKLISQSGQVGSYYPMQGKAQVGFTLGGFHGFITGHNRGIAINSTTGEMVRFDMKLDGKSFQMSNLRSVSKQSFEPTPDKRPSWSAALTNGVADAQGMRIKVNSDNSLEVQVESKKDNRLVKGKGYLDQSGNIVLAFENNTSLMAHYTLQDGKLSIYDQQYL